MIGIVVESKIRPKGRTGGGDQHLQTCAAATRSCSQLVVFEHLREDLRWKLADGAGGSS